MRLKTHRIYLFRLQNGKRRLGYGESAEHARRILSYRLTSQEMSEMTDEPPEPIRQQDLQAWVRTLG